MVYLFIKNYRPQQSDKEKGISERTCLFDKSDAKRLGDVSDVNGDVIENNSLRGNDADAVRRFDGEFNGFDRGFDSTLGRGLGGSAINGEGVAIWRIPTGTTKDDFNDIGASIKV